MLGVIVATWQKGWAVGPAHCHPVEKVNVWRGTALCHDVAKKVVERWAWLLVIMTRRKWRELGVLLITMVWHWCELEHAEAGVVVGDVDNFEEGGAELELGRVGRTVCLPGLTGAVVREGGGFPDPRCL